MKRPGKVIYTDGSYSIVKKEEIFLCPPNFDVTIRACYREGEREAGITESQYHGRQRSVIPDNQAN